jgi:hypothetical protein
VIFEKAQAVPGGIDGHAASQWREMGRAGFPDYRHRLFRCQDAVFSFGHQLVDGASSAEVRSSVLKSCYASSVYCNMFGIASSQGSA